MEGEWNSRWIGPGDDPSCDLGVFVFRRVFDIGHLHGRYDVRVSADQRYKLYVNGHFVCFGPQRGDLQHWFYENLDIAPYLRDGRNEIRAIVWNFGWAAPMAQMTARTAFLFDDIEFEAISTGEGWQVAEVPGWSFGKLHDSVGPHYIDIGPGESVDARALATPLLTADLTWRDPHEICTATEHGASGGGTPWMLVPRSIPLMHYKMRERIPSIRHGFLEDTSPQAHEGPAVFPRQVKAGERLLIDYEELLCAYPRIIASGKGKLTFTYAESCRLPNRRKNNRAEVEGKEVGGYKDEVILGQEPFEFEPLWWRTYRYLLIQAEGPATLHSLDAIETGYPLEIVSAFDADDTRVKQIWDVAARTAQRCAGETYFDCPYYEQLQYVGDTRIQALIGYYLSADRALQRAANKSFQWSTFESGLTQSRYPSRQAQVIPPFSLWWAAMLADQRLHDREGLSGFEREDRIERLSAEYNRLISHPEQPFWNFADWVPTWRAGVPALGARSVIHRLTDTYARLLHSGVTMQESDPNDPVAAEWLQEERERLNDFIKIEGLIREPDEPPSEHAESLYRLCQIELGIEPDPWPFSALERANAAKCTHYFSYYKHLAMQPEDYLSHLGPWEEMIEDGLTTFAENPEPTRSDCHAWSAHPMLGFFQIIAGVTSSSDGWRSCRIEPRPGRLRRFDALIDHLDGALHVRYEDGKITIDSPVPYELRWKGRTELQPSGSAVFE